jgi:hypothetical protein
LNIFWSLTHYDSQHLIYQRFTASRVFGLATPPESMHQLDSEPASELSHPDNQALWLGIATYPTIALDPSIPLSACVDVAQLVTIYQSIAISHHLFTEN